MERKRQKSHLKVYKRFPNSSFFLAQLGFPREIGFSQYAKASLTRMGENFSKQNKSQTFCRYNGTEGEGEV
jgi:hypothetical protein